MKDLYKNKEDCMAFSNETLEKYLFDKIKKEQGIDLVYSYCDDKHSDLFLEIKRSNQLSPDEPNDYLDKIHRIDCVSFDGDRDDFTIHFHNSAMVSVFLFDAQFMFIDDICKKDVRGIEGCIVYEGYLRDKTHEQILEIFFNLLKILHSTTKITYEENFVSRIGYYSKYNYTIKLIKPNCEKQAIQYDNFLFLIN